MPAFNIAANQQLAQPVSSFFQGKAMRIAEQNQARKMEIEEERLVREREAFELDTRLAENQEERAATAFDQGTEAHEMQMDASELEFMQKSFSDPITNNMLKEQFNKLKTLPPEDRAAEFYAAVGKENPQLAKFLAKYDDDGVVDDKEIDKFVSTLDKYLPDSEPDKINPNYQVWESPEGEVITLEENESEAIARARALGYNLRQTPQVQVLNQGDPLPPADANRQKMLDQQITDMDLPGLQKAAIETLGMVSSFDAIQDEAFTGRLAGVQLELAAVAEALGMEDLLADVNLENEADATEVMRSIFKRMTLNLRKGQKDPQLNAQENKLLEQAGASLTGTKGGNKLIMQSIKKMAEWDLKYAGEFLTKMGSPLKTSEVFIAMGEWSVKNPPFTDADFKALAAALEKPGPSTVEPSTTVMQWKDMK